MAVPDNTRNDGVLKSNITAESQIFRQKDLNRYLKSNFKS